MNEEEIEIARAFVACARWELFGGMLLCQGGWSARVGDGFVWDDCKGPILPDITDPATLGCIVQLVRDAMGDPGLHVRCTLPYVPSYNSAPPWVVCSGRGQRLSDRHTTETKALLQVLQAAPEAPSD